MAIVIVGAGSWGTTLAGLFNPQLPLRLWCRSPELVAPTKTMMATVAGGNRNNLKIEVAYADPPPCGEDIVVMAVPSDHVIEVARQIRERCSPPYPIIVTASKG